MSQCTSHHDGRRKLKAKHATREEAEKHAHWHQKSTIHKVEVYRCYNCKAWHIGRTPVLKQMRRELATKKAQEDYLVGRLIAAIKEAIGGPGYRAR